jgi:tetratricopeptide (TPR) repeat protein/transcriptional regulator with XRE-family HTH domain
VADQANELSPGSPRTFGEWVRAQRSRLGLTQEDLAERAEVSPRTVRNVESGSTGGPSAHTRRSIVSALCDEAPDLDPKVQPRPPDELAEPQAVHEGVLHGYLNIVPRAAMAASPAQLPTDVAAFTGRLSELAELDGRLGGDHEATSLALCTLSGTPGVGKTALAVRWALQARERFPGGQLYADLRGYGPEAALEPADALASFLTAVGVSSQQLPAELEQRVALYRTLVAGRRILVVLDNAAHVEQVRPLLPGAGCAVLVTSRDELAGLVARDGAYRISLGLLPPRDAVELLRRLIGERVEAEPEAAAELSEQCVRLPLALRLAAELAAARAADSLRDLVAELADLQERIELLDAGGDPRAAVSTVFSWSVRQLSPDAVRMLAVLSLHPGPDADLYAAAALGDSTLKSARRSMAKLTHASLIQLVGHGRYGMHDLLRGYATGLVDDPDAAVGRLYDHYLTTAAAAMNVLHPAEAHRRPEAPPARTPTPDFSDPGQARAWLDQQLPAIVTLAGSTAGMRWPDHTVRLSAVLFRYLDGTHHGAALAIHARARAAARRRGDLLGEARAINNLGGTRRHLGQLEVAGDLLSEALGLFRKADDLLGQARALHNLGVVHTRLGQYRQAHSYHKQSLSLYRRVADRTGETHSLISLGIIAQWRGRYDAAAQYHSQALTVAREISYRVGEASALANLANVEKGRGRYPEALDVGWQALALYRLLGDHYGEAYVLTEVGSVLVALDRLDEAAQCHRQALAQVRADGDRDGQCWALNGLAEVAQSAGHPDDALTLHSEALEIALDTGLLDQQARAYTGLGHACRERGEFRSARDHYRRAVSIYVELESPHRDQVAACLDALAHQNP